MSCPLVSRSINFFSCQNSKTHKKDPDDLEPADGDTQMEYSSGYLYSSNIPAVTKYYL
jgi:hypothetical protein